MHPDHQASPDLYAAAGRPSFHQGTPAEARAMLRASLAAAPAPTDLPTLAEVADETIDGPHGPIPVRRYVPAGGPLGTCVYLHSGGWVIGDLDFADATCRRLACAAGAEIVSIDYRLAPEHPHPQPLDDAFAALQWAGRARPGPLVVMGEGAGGNLAAACAIRARDAGGPSLAGQVLAYPATDHDLETASSREVGGRNWLLSIAGMAWFWDQYCPPSVDRTNPLVSPLRVAEASELPPTMLVVGELDPLRAEGLAYAAKLAKAGVPVRVRRDADMPHGYVGAVAAVPLAAEALAEVAAFVRERLQDRSGTPRQTGFRRRILIEPEPTRVTAELEDDWHRMVVSLSHSAGVVTEVSSEMKRRPWTTCPGAMGQLKATFVGEGLAGFARRGEKTLNCTHLYDLAVFAAAHADGPATTAYEAFVSDPVDGRREARLWRDGALVLDWTMQGAHLTSPPDLAGRTMGELGDWIAGQDRAGAEAARILRWASILALGRAMDIPAGLSATAFPSGACYTFQPEMARIGSRVDDASRDFSHPSMQPMADRSTSFPRP